MKTSSSSRLPSASLASSFSLSLYRIGIAIGPRTWFGDQAYNNISMSGTVLNNRLTGAFGYGIAMSSARNFTVENNVLIGNTSFIGSRGPNCSSTDTTPPPSPFVLDQSTVQSSTTQLDFASIPDGDGLTCIMPPPDGDFWPFGGNPNPAPGEPGAPGNGTTPPEGSQALSSGGLSGGAKAGIAIGVIFGVLGIALAAYFVRRSALKRAAARGDGPDWARSGYVENKTPP